MTSFQRCFGIRSKTLVRRPRPGHTLGVDDYVLKVRDVKDRNARPEPWSCTSRQVKAR